jgi:casein kinase 1
LHKDIRDVFDKGMNGMIAGKYELVKKISEGSFGAVFEGKNIRTQEQVAIKVELKKQHTKTLKMEAKFYQLLKDDEGFPHLKWYGSNDDIHYLVIDLLGPSLDKVAGRCELKQIIAMGVQMIQRIKTLHEKCILHRDIKPCNFLFGRNNSKKIYLIDMGFCKRYDVDGKHIEPKVLSHPIGTPNYISINVHNNVEPSRRDDMESLIYVLIYLLKGSVPWEHLSFEKEMAQLKLHYFNICEYNFIKEMISHVRNLKFEEKPNYSLLISILSKEIV